MLLKIYFFIMLSSICIFRFKAAQEMDDQVKKMAIDMKEIVNGLNEANSRKDSDDDVNDNKNSIIRYI